ncbi:MAG: hypothetical protein B0A82_21355 [Alkalinema sp. CACIAM 70d]|nr:MAG: hypothetical protein B0A82_21355 [Alkalinema sp. CACIAM 70d]
MPQDFSQRNLRQQSFAGQNLTGANFTGADIRGADFSRACLVNADFSHTKAGLPPPAVIQLLAFSIFLALLAGVITAYAGAVFGHLFTIFDPSSLTLGVFIAIVLLLFGITTLKNGLGFALGLVSLIAATAIVITVAITPSTDFAGKVSVSSLTLGGAISGVVGLAEAINLNRSSKLSLAVIFLGILTGTSLGVSQEEPLTSFIGVVLVSSGVLGLATYVGQQSLQGDRRYHLLRNLTIGLTTAGSTRFRNADLTDANFTGALLPSTDFRGAHLTRVCWLKAQLERANLDRTYLEHPAIRQLLTTGQGSGQTLDRLDLHGVNLQDANLTDASLVGADLSNATLQGANLFRAKLVQTQLYGANLSRVCLTGAYIQNWGISPETSLEAVQCEYIYMHLPTTQDPDPCRKPDNRQENFRDGDFADFIAPIMRTLDSYQQQNFDPRTLTMVPKTLDLYHHEGIDPSAAAIALQQLTEEHPEANIEVVSIEGRGNQKVRLQAQVSDTVDRSQLNVDYFDNYNQLKTLAYSDLQKLLASIAEKDARIRSLENMVVTAIGSNKFYIETYHHQGELIMSQSKGSVNISGVQGNVSGIAAAGKDQIMTGVAIGAISGSVTNTINQLPESPDPDNPGIKELLLQLKEAIEAETTLSDEDKAEALEQVKTLAEAGQKTEDGILQKSAKTAMKILKGTVASLPDAANLAEACAKLLPMISGLLMLA